MHGPTTGFELFLVLIANGCILRMKGEKVNVVDQHDFLTNPLRQLIRQHRDELRALLTATQINKQTVCPVSPSGRHQWYELTNGTRKCLSCLVPMAEAPASLVAVAANDDTAADAA
jgi:hypothetical protein